MFAPNFLVHFWEMKGSETFFRFPLSKKKALILHNYGSCSSRKQYTSFLLVTLRCCCLPGKLGKHKKFVLFLFSRSTKFSPFFLNLELGALSKLAHAYYVFRYEYTMLCARHNSPSFFARHINLYFFPTCNASGLSTMFLSVVPISAFESRSTTGVQPPELSLCTCSSHR